MNANLKRARLIVEFKQFQRLPEWPAIKLVEQGKSLENAKWRNAPWPLSPRGAVMRTRSFAE